MGAQSEDSTTRGHHRTTLIIAAVSTLSLATITPYLATSGFQQSNIAELDKSAIEQHQPTTKALDIGQQEQGIMQQTTDSNLNAKQGQTTVVVNGQQIEVPSNGSYSKTLDDSSGRTDITVESSRSGGSSAHVTSNSSSVQLNVHSESSSSSSD